MNQYEKYIYISFVLSSRQGENKGKIDSKDNNNDIYPFFIYPF